MPSLSNSKKSSTARTHGNEWGTSPGVRTLNHQIQRLRVGLERGTLDYSSFSPFPSYVGYVGLVGAIVGLNGGELVAIPATALNLFI